MTQKPKTTDGKPNGPHEHAEPEQPARAEQVERTPQQALAHEIAMLHPNAATTTNHAAVFAAAAETLAAMTSGVWGVMRDGPEGDGKPWTAHMEVAPGLTIGTTTHTEPIARISGYLLPAEANAVGIMLLRRSAPAALDLGRAVEHARGVRVPGNARYGDRHKARVATERALDAFVAALARETEHE